MKDKKVVTNMLATNYKKRIAGFLERMAEQPVVTHDYYKPSNEHILKFKGAAVMNGCAPKCDVDIKRQYREKAGMVDTSPCLT